MTPDAADTMIVSLSGVEPTLSFYSFHFALLGLVLAALQDKGCIQDSVFVSNNLSFGCIFLTQKHNHSIIQIFTTSAETVKQTKHFVRLLILFYLF